MIQHEFVRNTHEHVWIFLRHENDYDIFYCNRCLNYKKIKTENMEE